MANPATAITEPLVEAAGAFGTVNARPRPPSAFEQAFARLADGDRSAADLVFADLWPRLLRFCRRAVAETDAEDCAQRAMMTLFEQVSDFDPERSPLAWAYTLAAWECRTVRRKHSRNREHAAGDQLPEVAAGDDVELTVTENDLVQRALAVAAGLSEVDRETLYVDVLGQGDGSAGHRQRRHRMIGRLRSAWRKLYGPE